MRAAVYTDIREISIKEVPDPKPASNEVLIAPRYVGICGSDLSGWEYGMFETGTIIGHEFSGIVMAVGSDVRNVSPGDLVVPNSLIPCGSCSYCNENNYALCENMQMVGFSLNGGMAEKAVLPDQIVYRLPSTISLLEAVFIEPLAVVIKGLKRAGIRSGMTSLILGGGPIGLLSLLYARYLGVSKIILSEIREGRLQLASQIGADTVVNPTKESLSLTIERITRGRGVDVVIECTGAPEPTSEAFSLVKRGGIIAVLGICEEPVEADFMTGVLNELTIRFSYLGYSEFPEAIELIASKTIDVRPLITKVIPLDRVQEDGFEALSNPENNDVKIVVEIKHSEEGENS